MVSSPENAARFAVVATRTDGLPSNFASSAAMVVSTYCRVASTIAGSIFSSTAAPEADSTTMRTTCVRPEPSAICGLYVSGQLP